jgi:CrcB protein
VIAVAFVALAAAGTVARWQVGRLNQPDWPGGTLAVNLGAAFLLGLLHDATPDTLTLAGVALLGSYSTFSTVMRETAEARRTRGAAVYLTTTLVGGVALAYLGMQLS